MRGNTVDGSHKHASYWRPDRTRAIILYESFLRRSGHLRMFLCTKPIILPAFVTVLPRIPKRSYLCRAQCLDTEYTGPIWKLCHSFSRNMKAAQQTQNICITFVQCWTNVEDVGTTLHKCYTISCVYWAICLPGGGGPRVVASTAAFHARVRGSVRGLGGLKETKKVSSPSTCESKYCGEPPWPRGSVLGLRPPGLEFRILCLEDSVISIISPSSGGSPGPV